MKIEKERETYYNSLLNNDLLKLSRKERETCNQFRCAATTSSAPFFLIRNAAVIVVDNIFFFGAKQEHLP